MISDIFSSLKNAQELSALDSRIAALESASGAAKNRISETLTVDNKTIFETNKTITSLDKTDFFVNGQRVLYGYDFTINSTQVIFTASDFILKTGDQIEILFFV